MLLLPTWNEKAVPATNKRHVSRGQVEKKKRANTYEDDSQISCLAKKAMPMVLHQLKKLVTTVSGSRMSTGERSTGRDVAGGFALQNVVENVVLMLHRIITE